MPASDAEDDRAGARARAWRHARHAAICDQITPWRHGTVVRASAAPDFYDLNLVRVERDPAVGADALAALADRALEGLAHRRVDLEPGADGEPLRADFRTKGWKALRVLWMRRAGGSPRVAPAARRHAVAEVSYADVHELRLAWKGEDTAPDPAAYFRQAAEVARHRGARVLAICEGGQPVGFAQYERDAHSAEITEVYVQADRRGAGRGAALINSATDALGDVRDLWICADADDRARELYARLGFATAWRTTELLLAP